MSNGNRDFSAFAKPLIKLAATLAGVPVAGDLAGAGLDMVARDADAARDARPRLLEIAESVTGKLAAGFDGYDIDESRVVAALTKAFETLADSRALVALDLDPVAARAAITDAKASSELAEAEREVFDEAVDLVVRELVKAAPTLPDYAGARDAALLGRLTTLEKLVSGIAPGTRPSAIIDTLPSGIDDFVGRTEEEAKLIEILSAPCGGAAAVTALRGMGGIGKTTLAVRVSQAVKDKYPDGRLFVDLLGQAETPKSVEAAMGEVLTTLNPLTKPPEGDALTAAYRSALNGKRILLVLDNARDDAQARPLLPPPPCAAIVTARVALANVGKPILLGALSGEEARTLLREASGRDLTDAEANRLAELCARLPLALRVAAAHLATTEDAMVAEYIADLERSRLDKLRAGDDPRYDVRLVLETSVRLLVERDPDLAILWRTLSVFAGDFDREAAAPVWDRSVEDARAPLSELCRRSLLSFENGRYRLHDLMRGIAAGLEGISPANDADWAERARERHARHYLSVLKEANTLYLKGNDGVLAGLALWDRERAGILATAEWSRSGDSPTRVETAMNLPNVGAHVLALRLHPRERIVWREAALHAARARNDKRMTSIHLGNLGVAWANRGETRRAIELHEQQLTIAREIGDRRGEANALGNLGYAWTNLGGARRAIKFHKQQLTIAREIGDRRGEGYALGNLGIAWRDLGEARRAIEFHEQHLTIAREIGDRRGEGNALGNLGIAWRDLGETRRAIELHEQTLTIAREIGDRRGEGYALGNLGIAWRDLGGARRAIEFHEQHLTIAREIGDRRGEGYALGNLGIAWANLGGARRAIEFHEQHLTIARKIGDRRGEAIASFNAALAHDKLGDRAEAVSLTRRALVLFEANESPRAATARAQLAKWNAGYGTLRGWWRTVLGIFRHSRGGGKPA